MKPSLLRRFLPAAYTLLALLFLYLPIAVLMVMSFNESRYNTLPFSFSLKWYQALFHNDRLIEAALRSLAVGAITALLCVVLATLFVLSLSSYKRKTVELFSNLIMMPMSIPWLILALSLLLLIRFLDLNKSMAFVVAGHLVISLPYAVLVLQARMSILDPALEEMSASLGARPWTTLRRITLPALAPAMVAGGFLAFMVSFDNFAISYFLIPVGASTLPIEIQSSIKFGFTPEINAISTIIIGLSLLCVGAVGLIMGVGSLARWSGKDKQHG